MAKVQFPRRGAWAVVDGRVGIIDAITPTGADFHLTDDKGDTTLVLPNVPFGALTQATHEQIPAARLTKITPEHAARLGYRAGRETSASPVTATPKVSHAKSPVVASLGGRKSGRKSGRK